MLKRSDFDAETQEKIKAVVAAIKRAGQVEATRRNLFNTVINHEARTQAALEQNRRIEEAKALGIEPERLPKPELVPAPLNLPHTYDQPTLEDIAIKLATEGIDSVIEAEKACQVQDAETIVAKALAEKARAEAILAKIESADIKKEVKEG